MARKTLLNESEIRRFMKLANMGPLGAQRMEAVYPGPGARDELEDAEGDLAGMDAVADEEGGEVDDLEADLGAADDELAVDDAAMDDMAGDAGGTPMISVDDFMAAFETAMEEVLPDQEVQTVVDLGDDEAVEDAEGLEGGDVSLDGPDAEPAPEMDPGAMEDEVAMAGMQEQLVNKVAQRVARRLVKENRKAQMTEDLTERIFKRLIQK